MLRQNPPLIGLQINNLMQRDAFSQNRVANFDIQQELNRLEEIILDSPRVPLTGLTIVDEETLLEQLDLVRLNLPGAFAQALDVLRQKEEILADAEDYAQSLIAKAEDRAARMLDELGIIQEAEREASNIRKLVQQECEELQQRTLVEVEQLRRTTQQELEQLRTMTINECEDIQDGADEYADSVLNRIESQLAEMLKIIRNGRTQLHPQPQSPLQPALPSTKMRVLKKERPPGKR